MVSDLQNLVLMICYNNYKLGKHKNIETHFNSSTGEVFTIERELKKLRRGWGKHRIEDETHTVFCPRLNKVVTYCKGKPRYKDLHFVPKVV